jgi:RNA 3'-terminal phosphate cyclase (ATP)
MITIDGSVGEGGGQILRTALALSLVTGQPFRIERIRAGRKKAGLLRQHLTAVNAAAEIGCAKVEGRVIGSSQVVFVPGKPVPGVYHFAVGTAGSATLVLQTILPALLTASAPSNLLLEGGTHNPYAPPFDFLAGAFLPLLQRMGPAISVDLHQPGFYPAGGGKFSVEIEPSATLAPLELLERGPIRQCRARALVAALPRQIAERELAVVRARLAWPAEVCQIETVEAPCGPGNAIMLEIHSDHVTEIFTGFGERGVSAERVADSAVTVALEYLAAEVPVGEHLADQLLLPLALAGGGRFKTLRLSSHSQTNIQIIKKFLRVRVTIEPCERGNILVTLDKDFP